MKLVSTIVECDSYAIINGVFGDFTDEVTKEIADRPPLVCHLPQEKMELNVIDYPTEAGESLISNFSSVCLGEDPRWKLLQVQITGGWLRLFFADMIPISDAEDSEEVYGVCEVRIENPVVIYVSAVRHGNSKPDEYRIAYRGKNHPHGYVADIEEHRNGEYYATEIITCKDGKYYLKSERYD